MLKRPFVILLVEDNPNDEALFTELCQNISPDIEVRSAVHGQAALDYLDAAAAGAAACPRPDLILLDLNMPVMDGHTFLEQAKRQDSSRLIPIIALTSSVRENDIQRSYQNYASGYLVKPSTFDDMKALLQVVTSYWRGTARLPTLGELGR